MASTARLASSPGESEQRRVLRAPLSEASRGRSQGRRRRARLPGGSARRLDVRAIQFPLAWQLGPRSQSSEAPRRTGSLSSLALELFSQITIRPCSVPSTPISGWFLSSTLKPGEFNSLTFHSSWSWAGAWVPGFRETSQSLYSSLGWR